MATTELNGSVSPFPNGTEKKSRDGERHYRHVAPTAEEAVIFLDREGTIQFADYHMAQLLGYCVSDVVGHSWLDFIFPQDVERAGTRLERSRRGHTERFDFRFRHKDGSDIWVTACTCPNNSHADDITGIVGVFTDLAEQNKAQQALREWEQRLQLALAAAQLHVWTVDLSSQVVFASPGAAKIFGLPDDRPVAYSAWIDRVYAPDRKYVLRAREALTDGKARYDVQFRVRMSNGELRWVDSQAIVVHDRRSRPFQIYGVVSDITEKKRAERELHQRQQEFKSLVENAPDIISRLDRELRHLYVNPAVEDAWGVKVGDYLGRSKADLGLPDNMVRPWEHAARAAFATGQEQRFNFSFAKDGKTHYYSARMLPEFDRDGKVESVLGITYDETERTEIELERDASLMREQAARRQAEAATRARDEFLAVVSHELRSPLNGIQSWAHVLDSQLPQHSSSAIIQRALQGIRTGVAQQVHLIEDLLDVTGLMSGKLRLIKRPLPFLPAVQSAVDSITPSAVTKRIEIDTRYDISTEQIEGDPDRVQQIISNLLSNAVKFTPFGGHVWVSTYTRDEMVCVTVRDTGVGITANFLPELFHRFQQADASTTRAHGGLGLGLSMARHLVELHGGRISAESEGEDKGATFTVSFPLLDGLGISHRDDDMQTSSMVLPSLQKMRILLVDDHEEARESLTTLLRQNGAQVVAAASGDEALRSLEELNFSDMPHILLCDIAMPDEDGYSVLRRVRAWKGQHTGTSLENLPAVALTAFAQNDDRLRALSAGFQMYLAKPVAPQELVAVIVGLTRRA